jgi:hypothetical protein
MASATLSARSAKASRSLSRPLEASAPVKKRAMKP